MAVSPGTSVFSFLSNWAVMIHFQFGRKGDVKRNHKYKGTDSRGAYRYCSGNETPMSSV